MTFVVRRTILEEALKNSEWADRLNRAKNAEDMGDILTAYCKERGLKVVDVGEAGKK